jgi:hypothetical protein
MDNQTKQKSSVDLDRFRAFLHRVLKPAFSHPVHGI